MTTIAAHLSVEALRDRYVSSADVMEARHFQTIWLLAKGHGVGEVAEMTSFGQRWIEQPVARSMRKGRMRWAICAGAMVRRRECSRRRFSRSCGFACKKRPTTVVCGLAPRSRRSSRANWGWKKSPFSAAGRR